MSDRNTRLERALAADDGPAMLLLFDLIARNFLDGCDPRLWRGFDGDDLASVAMLRCYDVRREFDPRRGQAWKFFTRVVRNSIIEQVRIRQRHERGVARAAERGVSWVTVEATSL